MSESNRSIECVLFGTAIAKPTTRSQRRSNCFLSLLRFAWWPNHSWLQVANRSAPTGTDRRPRKEENQPQFSAVFVQCPMATGLPYVVWYPVALGHAGSLPLIVVVNFLCIIQFYILRLIVLPVAFAVQLWWPFAVHFLLKRTSELTGRAVPPK